MSDQQFMLITDDTDHKIAKGSVATGSSVKEKNIF